MTSPDAPLPQGAHLAIAIKTIRQWLVSPNVLSAASHDPACESPVRRIILFAATSPKEQAARGLGGTFFTALYT